MDTVRNNASRGRSGSLRRPQGRENSRARVVSQILDSNAPTNTQVARVLDTINAPTPTQGQRLPRSARARGPRARPSSTGGAVNAPTRIPDSLMLHVDSISTKLPKLKGDLDNCTICFEPLFGGDLNLRVRSCGHVFHDNCLMEVHKQYLRDTRRLDAPCPMCRSLTQRKRNGKNGQKPTRKSMTKGNKKKRQRGGQ